MKFNYRILHIFTEQGELVDTLLLKENHVIFEYDLIPEVWLDWWSKFFSALVYYPAGEVICPDTDGEINICFSLN